MRSACRPTQAVSFARKYEKEPDGSFSWLILPEDGTFEIATPRDDWAVRRQSCSRVEPGCPCNVTWPKLNRFRQLDRERAAFSASRVHVNRPTVALDHAPRYRKSKAAA